MAKHNQHKILLNSKAAEKTAKHSAAKISQKNSGITVTVHGVTVTIKSGKSKKEKKPVNHYPLI